MSADYKDRARKRAAERSTSIWYKLKEGPNTFRLLPTPEGKTSPAMFIEYQEHREVGPKKVQVRCGKDPVTGDGDCYICDKQIPKLERAGKQRTATALAPRQVLLVQLAMVDDDGKFTGPKIWSPSKTVGDQLLASVFGSKKRDYADAKKGYNLTVPRTGTGKNDTRYGMIEADDEPSVVPSSLIAKLKPFDQLKEIHSYSEAKCKAAIAGEDVVDDDDDDEDRPPSRTGKKKPRPVDDEDEDEDPGGEEQDDESEEEEDQSEEEDEEEVPAPKKKTTKPTKPAPGKKPKKPPVEEEPEEDEEDESDAQDAPDEEEDEDPPAKPAKKKPGKKPPVVEDDEEEEEPEDEEDDLNLDDEEEEEPEEEEEEPEPPKKKPTRPQPPPPPGKKRK